MKKTLTALGVITCVALIVVISLNTKNESYGKTGNFLAGNNYAKSEKGSAVPSDLRWGDPTSGMFGSNK